MIDIKTKLLPKKVSYKSKIFKVYLKTQNNKNQNYEKLIKFIKKEGLNKKKISNFCIKNYNFYSLIIHRNKYLFCLTDQVCSYPIIYQNTKNYNLISDDIKNFKTHKINKLSFKLIKYSGYTLDNMTIYDNVYNLLPNQRLLIQDNKVTFKKINHYNFIYKKNSNYKNLEAKFEKILLAIFKNIRDRNLKKKIFVPLSAGYDSRIILSMLKKLKVKNLETFTYGRKNLRDFDVVNKISKKIGVINHKIVVTRSLAIKTYRCKKFNSYLNFCNPGNAPNNFSDYLAIHYLIEKKIIKKGDVIINGQTGDFISGNHIPSLKLKKKMILLII